MRTYQSFGSKINFNLIEIKLALSMCSINQIIFLNTGSLLEEKEKGFFLQFCFYNWEADGEIKLTMLDFIFQKATFLAKIFDEKVENINY